MPGGPKARLAFVQDSQGAAVLADLNRRDKRATPVAIAILKIKNFCSFARSGPILAYAEDLDRLTRPQVITEAVHRTVGPVSIMEMVAFLIDKKNCAPLLPFLRKSAKLPPGFLGNEKKNGKITQGSGRTIVGHEKAVKHHKASNKSGNNYDITV